MIQKAKKEGEAILKRPDNWGGYQVKPKRFEFWQGEKGRMHDRFQYVLEGDHWKIVRLAP